MERAKSDGREESDNIDSSSFNTVNAISDQVRVVSTESEELRTANSLLQEEIQRKDAKLGQLENNLRSLRGVGYGAGLRTY